jgi:hypothetical protein
MQNTIDQALNEIKADILKAAETTSSYTFSPTTRSVFSPENLDERIKFLVPIDTPLRNRFPRSEGSGQHAEWKRMTSALHSRTHSTDVANAGTATSIAFADANAPGETTQTYDAKVQAYKLLGRKLEVGGLALAASRGRDGEPDMQRGRERIKAYEVMLGEEEMIIAGDTDNSANEFNGLNDQITTNSGAFTGFVTYSGVANLARTLYREGADPTLLVASPRQLQALADDIQNNNGIYRGVISQSEVADTVGGFALSKIVNPVTQSLIDVKPSRFVGFGGLLLTEKSPAGEVWIEMDELIPMSRVDVPSTTFSYVSFILEAVALKVIGEPFQLKFTNGALA